MTQGTFRFMKPSPKKTSQSRRTVATARREVMAKLDEGTTCPCCDQYCKLYKRRLNSAMARALINLVKIHETDPRWINIHELNLLQGRKGGGDFAKLVHWGLIEEQENADEDKKNSGYWRPTTKGYQFVRRRISVPSHVHIYNNQVHGFSDKQIDIEAALGDSFSYKELMNS